jgi:hypothetical protein
MFHLAPVLGLDGLVQYFIGVQVDVTARTEETDVLTRNSQLAGKSITGIAGLGDSVRIPDTVGLPFESS